MKKVIEQVWQELPPISLPSPVFALAAGQGGIWAGGVGGASWHPAPGSAGEWKTNIATVSLSSVAALLTLDKLVLVGSAEGIVFSRDAGITWLQAELEDGIVSITAFAASPEFGNDRTLLAATMANGILRSNDAGSTWTNASVGLESQEVTALVWGPGSSILAATSTGIYRSLDTGRAWHSVYADKEVEIEALAYLPDGTILATQAAGGLLRSEDEGQHWSSDDRYAQQVSSLLVTPAENLLRGTIEDGIQRSTDGGKTWQTVNTDLAHTLTASDGSIYAGTSSGVSVSSDDGLTWQELPYPPIHDLRTLLVCGDQLLLAGMYTGIVHLTAQQTWENLTAISQPLTAQAVLPDNTLLLSSPDGLVHASLEDETRQDLITGPEGQVAHITVRPQEGHWQAWAASADGSRLLHSADSGTSWQTLPPPFGVLPVVALQATPDAVVAATYDPRQHLACVWYSKDDGQTWKRSGEAQTTWPIVTTNYHPTLLSIGNILLRHEAPENWREITANNHVSMIRRVLSIQQETQETVYLLSTAGIQSTQSDGADWQSDETGFPGEHIIDIVATPDTLYALLIGGRLWKRKL